jgi:hypothetical protein
MLNIRKTFGHDGDAAFRRAYDKALNDVADLIERHGEPVGLAVTVFVAGWLAAEHFVPFDDIVDGIKTVMDAHGGWKHRPRTYPMMSKPLRAGMCLIGENAATNTEMRRQRKELTTILERLVLG